MTRVIVDDFVTVIKKNALYQCELLVSLIMGDSVKRIEGWAFYYCDALQFIRLSKALKYIGTCAFTYCRSLEALFLPSTVKSIGYLEFNHCDSLRLLVLPNGIDLRKVGNMITIDTGIQQVARTAGVEYDYNKRCLITDKSCRRVNEWLIHHMDAAPFHKVCYNSSITTRHINDCLAENGTDAALTIDHYHEMTLSIFCQ